MSLKKNTDISKFVVSQSNKMIEANYSPELTAQSLKIARFVISLISPEDDELRYIRIPMNTLKRYMGMKPNTKWGAFKKRLDESCSRLNKEELEIQKAEGGYLKAPFLSSWEVFKEEDAVEFEISSKLKPYLLELQKNYTTYLLAHIPKLRSGYSIRLYELLHQYRKIGKRRFEFDDLQKKVGSSYSLYGDFKRKVIIQAQNDLKKNTDLAFTFNEIKTGRKITALEFILFGNKPEKEDNIQLNFLEEVIDNDTPSETPALSAEIIESLNSLSINEQKISKYLAKGFDIIKDESQRQVARERCVSLNNYYLEKLELTKSGAKKENPAGYLVAALEGDWIGGKTVEKVKNIKFINERKEKKQSISLLKKQYEDLKKQYEASRNPQLEILVNDEIELTLAFDSLKDRLGYKAYIKPAETPLENYRRSPFISSAVNLFFEKKYPERFVQSSNIFKIKNQVRKQIQSLKD